MNYLQDIWFVLIGVLLAGYIILDGYDLGVGFWHLFTKKEGDRRSLLRAIMPYWDGNEVWLLTGGGAVFAAFPAVYATVFSGFYLALMLVLFALIFRAVSIEFRNQSDSPRWQRGWDIAFGVGSTVPALLFGVAAGNILRGLPLNTAGDFTGTFFTLLNPYSLLIGVTGLAMFATHGALFAALKTEGELAATAVSWAKKSGVISAALYLLVFVTTLVTQRQLFSNFGPAPVLWLLPLAATTVPWVTLAMLKSGSVKQAFLSSSAGMLLTIAAGAAAIFPKMVPALYNPANSLTVANASSSDLTLLTMLILAAIGVPIVLAYTVWVHRMFSGKVSEEVAY